jgi:hypothetical protein
MEKDKPIWSGKRIMDRWGISSTELGSYIYNGLPAYQMVKGEFRRIPPEEINHFDEAHMTDFVFLPVDVEAFEKEYGPFPPHEADESKLSAEEARELGRLRNEKHNWDRSIAIAIEVGRFCACHEGLIMKNEVFDHIFKIDKNIPNTTIEKIWKLIPPAFKKKAGSPRKNRSEIVLIKED